MMAKAPVSIRRMRHDDLAAADRLRAAAGWNQTLADWQRFLACAPHGCFVAETQRELVGTVTTISYGSALGWVGMMLVAPDHRRRGIASALLQRAVTHLQEQGVCCIKLDATPAGEPVYRQFGFTPEFRLARWAATSDRDVRESDVRELEPLLPTDLPAVVALDRESFGVSRPELLARIVAQSVCALLRRAPDHTISGFGLLREGSRAFYLGPVVAVESAQGAALACTLLQHAVGKPVFWDILDSNLPATECARGQGFTVQRSLLRMFYGPPGPPIVPERQWAIVDPAVG